MRVLVTGGAGFIGSHLVRRLISDGHQAVVLDNLCNGKLENLPLHADLDLLIGDMRLDSDVEPAVAGCDAIVHLAAEASVQKSVETPISTHEVNFVGALRLVNFAKSAGVRRIVFASSAAVYGVAERCPVRETDRLRPMTQYALDKLAVEFLLEATSHLTGATTTALRFFNVYGERQDPRSPYSGVVSIFLDRLSNGLPIQIFGDGLQTRDFVYVGDVVDAIMAALAREDSSFLVCNVATGKSATVLDLLEQLSDCVGRSSEVIFRPGRTGDIRDSFADVTRLCEQLGVTSRTSLREGLSALCRSELASRIEFR